MSADLLKLLKFPSKYTKNELYNTKKKNLNLISELPFFSSKLPKKVKLPLVKKHWPGGSKVFKVFPKHQGTFLLLSDEFSWHCFSQLYEPKIKINKILFNIFDFVL